MTGGFWRSWKAGPPEARRKRPRRNESPRCARSLLSSEPVSSFPKRKRFAGLHFGAWPRRNESPRCARSLLSSEPVSSFPKHKRFAGLCFGGGLDGKSPRAAREASYPLSPFPPLQNINASLVYVLGVASTERVPALQKLLAEIPCAQIKIPCRNRCSGRGFCVSVIRSQAVWTRRGLPSASAASRAGHRRHTRP